MSNPVWKICPPQAVEPEPSMPTQMDALAEPSVPEGALGVGTMTVPVTSFQPACSYVVNTPTDGIVMCNVRTYVVIHVYTACPVVSDMDSDAKYFGDQNEVGQVSREELKLHDGVPEW